MSHFTDVKTQITSEEDIRACLDELGYVIIKTNTVRGYSGTKQVVDFAVVTQQGGYQIGLRKGSDGNYEIVADWWGVKGVSEKEFVRQLTVKYAERKVLAHARKKGYRVINETPKDRGVAQQLLLVRRAY